MLPNLKFSIPHAHFPVQASTLTRSRFHRSSLQLLIPVNLFLCYYFLVRKENNTRIYLTHSNQGRKKLQSTIKEGDDWMGMRRPASDRTGISLRAVEAEGGNWMGMRRPASDRTGISLRAVEAEGGNWMGMRRPASDRTGSV